VTREFRIRDASWSVDGEALRHVRRIVFVVEQQIPEALEWDADDPVCLHALAIDANDDPIGTGRLLADGHVGRLAVLAERRGSGVGSALLEYLCAAATGRGHRALLLNAQCSVVQFYRGHGFELAGDEYIEAGIPHVPMRKLAPR